MTSGFESCHDGEEAEREAGEQGDGEREEQDQGIECISSARGIWSPAHALTNSRPAAARQDAERPSHESEDDVLRHHLGHHVAAARAEGVADRDLAAARGVARERQIRDVRARDEQQAGHRGEQDEVGLALVSHQVVEERIHIGRSP